MLIGRLLGLSRKAARERAVELLEDFALSEAAPRPAKTYSGGMRRRLDLAASLVGRRGRVAATGTPDQLKAKVGGQILVVSPVDEVDLGTVVGVVGELSGDDPDVAQGAVSVAVNDASLPPAILQRLTTAGVQVAELSLRKPSLDEVFFTLTGHRASVEDAGADDQNDRSAA